MKLLAVLLPLALLCSCNAQPPKPARKLPVVLHRDSRVPAIPTFVSQSPYQYPLYRFPPRHYPGDRPSRNPATPPVSQNTPPPVYPSIAIPTRITGSVVLDIVIDRDGSVSGYRILKPLPFGLNEAAINAVTNWKYTPARNAKGKPVVSVITVTVPVTPPSPAPGK